MSSKMYSFVVISCSIAVILLLSHFFCVYFLTLDDPDCSFWEVEEQNRNFCSVLLSWILTDRSNWKGMMFSKTLSTFVKCNDRRVSLYFAYYISYHERNLFTAQSRISILYSNNQLRLSKSVLNGPEFNESLTLSRKNCINIRTVTIVIAL